MIHKFCASQVHASVVYIILRLVFCDTTTTTSSDTWRQRAQSGSCKPGLGCNMMMNVYPKFVLSDVTVSEGEMFIAVLFWTTIISLIPRPSTSFLATTGWHNYRVTSLHSKLCVDYDWITAQHV